MLKDHPNYSARKLAEVIGITPKAVEKYLVKLKAEGLIKEKARTKADLGLFYRPSRFGFFGIEPSGGPPEAGKIRAVASCS